MPLCPKAVFRLFPHSIFDDVAVHAGVPLEAAHINLTDLIPCGMARTGHSFGVWTRTREVMNRDRTAPASSNAASYGS